MAKALKIVGLAVAAVGVGLVTAGFGAVAFTGLITATISTTAIIGAGLALEVASSLLSKSDVPSSQTSRLTASIDPRAFRKTVLGSTAMATDVRYEEWFGADQEYCGWIVALASHRIDGVDQIWINTDLAWSATGGVVAKYQGYFFVQKIVTEGSPTNTTIVSTPDAGRWNTAHRLTGCAYVHLQFRVTGVDKKAESPFLGGPPSRITIVGRGSPVYDPRRDSTVAGGSGPMRAADQSTWRFTDDDGTVLGNNLPLQILRVLLGWRITNPVTGQKRLATGCGIAPKRIDLASFMTAASQADELVTHSATHQLLLDANGAPAVDASGNYTYSDTAQTMEPRFRGAGVISEGDAPKTSLDALCAGCCARFLDVGGRLSIALAVNDLAEAATDDGLFTEDVVGAFTWDPDPALEQSPNVVRGRYVDPSAASLYQLVDYPEVRIDSVDGMDRIQSLELGMVESASQAQRIAKQVLERKQYQRTFTAPFDIRAWSWPVGKVVPFTFAPLGFDRRLFRVAEQEIGQDGICNMVLDEESPAIYAWDADDVAPVQAAPAIVYDPSRSPFAQAIGTVAGEIATQAAAIGSIVAGTTPAGNAATADTAALAQNAAMLGDQYSADDISALKARLDKLDGGS